MKNNITEHVFILDRSGSMAGLERDTIGGFNSMIKKQKEKYGWEFLFIGANIDAVETAARYGINRDRAVNYNADEKGTRILYETVSDTLCAMRQCTPITANWSDKINEDYKKRGKK